MLETLRSLSVRLELRPACSLTYPISHCLIQSVNPEKTPPAAMKPINAKRILLIEAGLIMAMVVIASSAYFLARSIWPKNSPSAEVAAVVVTPTRPATPLVALPNRLPTFDVTPIATSPTATATLVPATAAPADVGLERIAAYGWQQPYICPAGSLNSDDTSKQDVLDFWNKATELWNGVVDSETALDNAIPDPFTLESASASPTFLAEARRYETVLLDAINRLLALRSAGTPQVAHEMGLRQGDFYDLERLTIQDTIRAIVEHHVAAWNESAYYEKQRVDYLDRARTEMTNVCNYLSDGPAR
jgi:hypothetical protein